MKNRLAMIWMLLACPAFLYAQAPGQLHTVRTPSGTEIAFRYCPPTDSAPTGNPQKPGSPVRKLRGFYISETEVTQSQFADILGTKALKTVRTRLAKSVKGSALQSYPTGDYFPVPCLAVDEAIAVCSNLSMAPANANPSIETATFRLPADVEWQYASRAGDIPKRPHFHFDITGWDQKLTFPPGSSYAESGTSHFDDLSVTANTSLSVVCENAWQKLMMAGSAGFRRNQEDFLTIVTTISQDKGRMGAHTALMTAVLWQGIEFGQQLPITSKMQPIRPAWQFDGRTLVATGHKNDWHIADLFSGVREWCFRTSLNQSLNQAWRQLVIETERQKGITEVVAAGAHTHSSDWQDFLIWHNRKPISADSLAPLPDDKLDATWTSNNAGVRLVLTRDLRDDWLATVRTTAIQATPNEATIQMNAYERALNDLVEDSDRPDAMQKLDFYRAISAAKDPASNRSLAALSGSLGMDDPFFRLLGKTLSAEQVGGNQ